MAGCVQGRRLGCSEGGQDDGPTQEAFPRSDSMDLSNRHLQESSSIEIPIRPVDSSHDPDADLEEVPDTAVLAVDRTSLGPAGPNLSETDHQSLATKSFSCRAMAQGANTPGFKPRPGRKRPRSFSRTSPEC